MELKARYLYCTCVATEQNEADIGCVGGTVCVHYG